MRRSYLPGRDRALIADYVVGGLTQRELAERYGLTAGGVAEVLRRRGVKLSPGERLKRNRDRMTARQHCPEFCRARAEGLWRGRSGWPDCPPELRNHYRLYRSKGFSAAEARAAIEGHGG